MRSTGQNQPAWTRQTSLVTRLYSSVLSTSMLSRLARRLSGLQPVLTSHAHPSHALPSHALRRPAHSYAAPLYQEELQRSLASPEQYWAEIADGIVWTKGLATSVAQCSYLCDQMLLAELSLPRMILDTP